MSRRFLFLQGPHGPFFSRLAARLDDLGHDTRRIGFNAGDAWFWHNRSTYTPYDGTDWTVALQDTTDLILYGDSRPHHAAAITAAQGQGVTVHVFEEGYLRPYWATYERDGSNGNSQLMRLCVADMAAALPPAPRAENPPPGYWGDMRQHVFYGALYHWFVLFRNRGYTEAHHRPLSLGQETALYSRRLALMPFTALRRRRATKRILRGGYPFHVALMQLDHDANFREHSQFDSTENFIQTVLAAFAQSAPPEIHMVFKAHPLENGHAPHRVYIKSVANRLGLTGRVHYLRGGKLAELLDHAIGAVTVNSTSAQQAAWRGLPIKVLGDAVYAKPEFTSAQSLTDFFAAPKTPDRDAYLTYRDYLLATSQVPGGYYASKSRAVLLDRATQAVLAGQGPYATSEKTARAVEPSG